ncbi:MAG TPA: hypothetical protein PKH31_10385, partial [Candidatus Sumerlaeota bacterium]|nr:hypothetical protein [Candidatus Sumerlaeota bacterium]
AVCTVLLLCFALVSCKKAADVTLPVELPKAQETSYSQALKRFGRLTKDFRVGTLRVQTTQVQDETGSSAASGAEIPFDITKMIMSGLPPDLSDDEAYAVQDYFAATLARDSEAHLFDPEALSEQLEDDFGEPVATHALGLLTSGVKESQMLELCEWVAEQDVSRELLVRLHMLIFGRLPESDEPTFNDTDEGAYAARFGYLTGQEVALVADEMSELTEEAEGEIRSLACLLATLMHYCASHARDLVVTLEE